MCVELTCVSVAPRIDRTNLKTTKVKVGKQILLDVDVSGEPPPEVKWFLDGALIMPNQDPYHIENVDHNTKFAVNRGKRQHTGKYKIVATNEHGEDQEWVELVFLGPPSRPMGAFLSYPFGESACSTNSLFAAQVPWKCRTLPRAVAS